MTEDEVEQAVLQLLRKRIEKPSSVYHALTKLNEGKLVGIVRQKRNDPKLVEYIKRRNYYTNKVYGYLNEQAGGRPVPVKPPQVSGSNSGYRGPEAKFITHRYHAEQYVNQRLLADKTRSAELTQLVESQLQHQKTWAQDAASIEQEYEQKALEISSTVAKSLEGLHPSKLRKLQSNNTLESLDKEYDQKREAHYKRVYDHCKHLSLKTTYKFEEWEVPFFCTVETFKYPGIRKDQEFIIDYITKKVMDSNKKQHQI